MIILLIPKNKLKWTLKYDKVAWCQHDKLYRLEPDLTVLNLSCDLSRQLAQAYLSASLPFSASAL